MALSHQTFFGDCVRLTAMELQRHVHLEIDPAAARHAKALTSHLVAQKDSASSIQFAQCGAE